MRTNLCLDNLYALLGNTRYTLVLHTPGSVYSSQRDCQEIIPQASGVSLWIEAKFGKINK